MNAVRVIGVGSPFGNDDIGWRVIDRLKLWLGNKHLLDSVDLIACDRPGVGLIHMLKDAEFVVLVDAILDTEKPGEIIILDSSQIIDGHKRISSHDMDIASAITLAATIQSLPPHLQIIGLGIDPYQPTSISETTISSLSDVIVTVLGDYLRCHIST